jgi:CRP-like cAMP-binding protein
MKKVRTYEKGDSFGQVALIHDGKRLATVKCDTDCTFAFISRENFFLLFKKPQQELQSKRFALYRQFRMLSKLDYKVLESLQLFLEKRKYLHGDIIYNEE